MKKNGFIATALMYPSFLLILLLLAFLVNSYSQTLFVLSEYKVDIREEMLKEKLADINIYLYVRDNVSDEYREVEDLPYLLYDIDNTTSCDNPDTVVTFIPGTLKIKTNKPTTCRVYMTKKDADMVLNVWVNDSGRDNDFVLSEGIPGSSFSYTYLKDKTTCMSMTGTPMDANIISFDENSWKFNYASGLKSICNVYFLKKNADIELHMLRQNERTGQYGFDGKHYEKVLSISEIDLGTYHFNKYYCNNEVTQFSFNNGVFDIKSNNQVECWAYFDHN